MSLPGLHRSCIAVDCECGVTVDAPDEAELRGELAEHVAAAHEAGLRVELAELLLRAYEA